MQKDPEKAREQMYEELPPSDREVLDRPEIQDQMVKSIGEMSRNGMQGAVQSIALEGLPWGFALEDIAMKVHVFHGDADSLALPATAHYVAGRLPDCELHMYPGDGHMAVVADRAEDVIRALLR
jgi:pimeloyl-ACP methyl ester carboxylesterase